MSANPVVSVVVVNYRSYRELSACLSALKEHSRDLRIEVVVIDHESDLSRASIVQDEFPGFTVVTSPTNDGFAAGVNVGARRTTAPYLLLLNPDTIVSAGLLHTLADRLARHPDVAVVGPRILNADGTIQQSARRFPDITTGLGGRMSWLTSVAPDNWFSRRNLEWSHASEPVEVDWVSGACLMVRRAAFDVVGGMDERFFLYWEDADLCQRLRSAGYRTVYVPTVAAVHEGSRASRHAVTRSLVAFHRSAFHYYWKHSGLLGRMCAPIVQALLWGRLLFKLALLKR